MAELKPISADSHVNEPADLWLERIDKRFRDRAPRVVDDIPGRPRAPTWSSRVSRRCT